VIATALTVGSPVRQDAFRKEDLVRDLRALGVRQGDLLNAKVSLKSVGYVDGGADALLQALLEAVGPSGTIVTDSFVNVYPLPLSEENARKISDVKTPSYAGALANALIRHPAAHRSTHPVQKFAAIGAQAAELMSAHVPTSYAYDVLRVMSERGARNLKIGSEEKTVGVGTTHVAIGLLGFRQKRERAGINYRDASGRIVTFERDWAGACAKGLGKFLPYYGSAGGILSEGRVGHAEAKLTDMQRTLNVELEMLRRDPSFFMCDDPACVECRLSWEFSDGNLAAVLLHTVLRRRRSAVVSAVRIARCRNYLPPIRTSCA
jgi:aminoglycoside 3-N-acetyltransferase